MVSEHKHGITPQLDMKFGNLVGSTSLRVHPIILATSLAVGVAFSSGTLFGPPPVYIIVVAVNSRALTATPG